MRLFQSVPLPVAPPGNVVSPSNGYFLNPVVLPNGDGLFGPFAITTGPQPGSKWNVSYVGLRNVQTEDGPPAVHITSVEVTLLLEDFPLCKVTLEQVSISGGLSNFAGWRGVTSLPSPLELNALDQANLALQVRSNPGAGSGVALGLLLLAGDIEPDTITI
jgi:hypothetical protein